MSRLQIHLNNIIKYDLANTFLFKNVFELPKITKITLSLSSPKLISNKKLLLTYLIFLEIITGIQGSPILSKKNKIQLQIKKNDIVGCKVILTNNKIYEFLEIFILQVLPNLENKSILLINKKNFNTFNFILPDILKFPNLETESFRFASTPPLQINIKTNCKTYKQTQNLLQSFNLPITNKV